MTYLIHFRYIITFTDFVLSMYVHTLIVYTRETSAVLCINYPTLAVFIPFTVYRFPSNLTVHTSAGNWVC